MFIFDDVKWHYAYPCNSDHNYFINIIILLAKYFIHKCKWGGIMSYFVFFSLNCYNFINLSNLWNLKSWKNYEKSCLWMSVNVWLPCYILLMSWINLLFGGRGSPGVLLLHFIHRSVAVLMCVIVIIAAIIIIIFLYSI